MRIIYNAWLRICNKNPPRPAWRRLGTFVRAFSGDNTVWIRILLVIAAVLIVAAMFFRQQIERGIYQSSLFTGADQTTHFVRQDRYFPVNPMAPAAPAKAFTPGDALSLPQQFTFGEQRFRTNEFLQECIKKGL